MKNGILKKIREVATLPPYNKIRKEFLYENKNECN